MEKFVNATAEAQIADRAEGTGGEPSGQPVPEKSAAERAPSVFSAAYWREAARNFSRVKILVFAALICALRIAVKSLRIPIIPGSLYLTFDAYVNALGSLVYGPLVALCVGAVSDTIGAVLFPSGAYFFPFIAVEMTSSFLFALFFWKRKISAPRAILAKFAVSFVCNIVLNSLLIKWSYSYFATGQTYNLINGVRIVKNLVLIPLEGMLIVFILNAFLPVLKQFRFISGDQKGLKLRKRDILLAVGLTLLAVALVLFYVFFLKDFMSEHNFKFF